MANSASARKRVRQAERRREHNVALRSRMRTYMKKVVNAIAAGDKANAQAAYKEAVPMMDAGVTKGLMHKNKAARHKSRLNARIRAL